MPPSGLLIALVIQIPAVTALGGGGGGGDGMKMGQDLIPVEVRIGRVCRFCLLHG